MAPLGVIGEIYIVSIGVGSIYLLIGLVMGQLHGHGDAGLSSHGHGNNLISTHHGDIAAHPGSNNLLGHHDTNVYQNGTAVNHGIAGSELTGHPLPHTGGGVGHLDTSSQSALAKSTPAPSHHAAHLDIYPTSSHPQLSTTAADHLHVVQIMEKRAYRAGKALLTLLSPMTLATFLAFFGLSGLLFAHVLPTLGALTALPAAMVSMFITSQVLRLLRLMVYKLDVSSVARVNELIGQQGEILTPIRGGHLGEVTYVLGSKRLTAPAKAAKPDWEFKLGDKVMISDLRDNVVYVEPYQDLLLDNASSTVIYSKVETKEE